jgi:hypothetical protein
MRSSTLRTSRKKARTKSYEKMQKNYTEINTGRRSGQAVKFERLTRRRGKMLYLLQLP